MVFLVLLYDRYKKRTYLRDRVTLQLPMGMGLIFFVALRLEHDVLIKCANVATASEKEKEQEQTNKEVISKN